MKLKFHKETNCSDYDIENYNHFECPKCSDSYAGFLVCGDILLMDQEDEITCVECGAVFVLSEKTDNVNYNEWEFLYDQG